MGEVVENAEATVKEAEDAEEWGRPRRSVNFMRRFRRELIHIDFNFWRNVRKNSGLANRAISIRNFQSLQRQGMAIKPNRTVTRRRRFEMNQIRAYAELARFNRRLTNGAPTRSGELEMKILSRMP